MFAIKIQRVLYITLAWIWIAKKVSMNVLNSDLLKLLFGLVFDGVFFKVKFLPCGILMVFVPCLRATVNFLSKIHVFRSGKIWKCWSFCCFVKARKARKNLCSMWSYHNPETNCQSWREGCVESESVTEKQWCFVGRHWESHLWEKWSVIEWILINVLIVQCMIYVNRRFWWLSH